MWMRARLLTDEGRMCQKPKGLGEVDDGEILQWGNTRGVAAAKKDDGEQTR